jgi:hypothetical protein
MTFKEYILESNNVNNIAQQFYDEYLSKFQTNQHGSHNCAWATEEFIKWARNKGIDAKAIYFVWPTEQKVSELKQKNVLKPSFAAAGESHIAPVVGNKIVDFTYKQFDSNFNEIAKVTDLSKWKSTYSKYGYGSNKVNVDGKPKAVIVNDFNTIKNLKPIGGINTIYPSKPIRSVRMGNITKAAGLAAGLGGINQALMNELPAGSNTGGGLGIKGKFEAIP